MTSRKALKRTKSSKKITKSSKKITRSSKKRTMSRKGRTRSSKKKYNKGGGYPMKKNNNFNNKYAKYENELGQLKKIEVNYDGIKNLEKGVYAITDPFHMRIVYFNKPHQKEDGYRINNPTDCSFHYPLQTMTDFFRKCQGTKSDPDCEIYKKT